MLDRIWGRTSLRSSTRNHPNIQYSPFGSVESLSPPPQPSHTRWVTMTNDLSTALTLIGYAIMNQRMVRVHGHAQDVDRLKGEINALLPSLSPAIKRSKGTELGQQFVLEIEIWNSRLEAWEKARIELEQITFGALNSLEVLQTILNMIQGVPVHLFHDVATHLFDWTNEEYRMLDGILEEMTPSRQILFTRFYQLDSELVDARVLADSPAEDTLQKINGWLEDLITLSNAWNDLTSQIHRKFRQQSDHVDWSHTWQDLERSTLNRFQDDPDLQEQLLAFTSNLNLFEQSVHSSGLIRSWSGFQSISFAEIKQEIRLFRRRFERLQRHLHELREIAVVKTWFSELPLTARELIKSHDGQDMTSYRSAFTVWYLSRWIEYKTPANAWIGLACRDDMSRIQDRLDEQANRWLQQLGQTTETNQWSDWLIDANSSGSALRNQTSSQTVDLFLDNSFEREGNGILIQPLSFDHLNPELNRMVRFLADLPAIWREELPSPIHRYMAFWSRTELHPRGKGRSSLSIEWFSDHSEG